MWEPKPKTFWLMPCLKPTKTQTANTMMAVQTAMQATPMRRMRCVCLWGAADVQRRAIKNGRFITRKFTECPAQ